MTRVEQYAKVIGAVAVTVGLLKTGYDWWQHRAEAHGVEVDRVIAMREATLRAVTELSSPDAFDKVKAIDTLTYVMSKDTSLLRTVYPAVLSFVATRTRATAAVACGSSASLREAEDAQAASDVTRALELLRRFGPTSRALRDSRSRVNLTRANLAHVNLSQADLRRAVFDEACLDRATLDGAALDSARFTRASLRHAMMRNLRGYAVVFNHADLDSTRFDGDTLINASFVNANLAHAWFENAILAGADLSGARVGWSYWRSARLTGSQYWSEVDSTSVAGALLYQATGIAPADLKRLRRLGACVDSIGIGDWDNRLTTPQARDARCGKAIRSPKP